MSDSNEINREYIKEIKRLKKDIEEIERRGHEDRKKIHELTKRILLLEQQGEVTNEKVRGLQTLFDEKIDNLKDVLEKAAKAFDTKIQEITNFKNQMTFLIISTFLSAATGIIMFLLKLFYER